MRLQLCKASAACTTVIPTLQHISHIKRHNTAPHPAGRVGFTPQHRDSFRTSAARGAVHQLHDSAASAAQTCTVAPAVALGGGVFNAAWLFGATTALLIPTYTLMAVAPASQLTRKLMLERALPCILLALVYVFMLGISARAGAIEQVVAAVQPLNIQLPMIGALFENQIITLLTWVHLITLDLWQAREVMIDGLKEGVFTAHSVWLCFIFGPIGLLSHLLTKWLTKQQRQRKAQ